MDHLAGPALVLAVFAVAMHLGSSWKLLPQPRPTLDTDRTILIHQAESSRTRSEARILLMGDSSCLMNVSAPQLSKQLGLPVLSLATLSYLDAGANSRLLREFVRVHPGQVKAIVLLMHPEALRRSGSESYQLGVLTNYLAGREHRQLGNAAGQFAWWSGIEIYRERVLARIVPTPLPGAFGREFGFNTQLERYLMKNHGSLLELDSAPLTGSTEYRLSPALQVGAAEFRATVPQGTQLLVGFTPVAQRLANSDFPDTRDTLLRQWADWLGTQTTLTELPPVWPDSKFARPTHLKPEAVTDYTQELGQAIQRHLQ